MNGKLALHKIIFHSFGKHHFSQSTERQVLRKYLATYLSTLKTDTRTGDHAVQLLLDIVRHIIALRALLRNCCSCGQKRGNYQSYK